MAYWWDEGEDAGTIPADAAEPAPEARVLGARDGPHRGLARAARGLPVLGARRGDGRRGAGLEQERRVARGRAVLQARLDGGDDAARDAVAVPVGLAAPGAPRVVAGRLEPREALVPLVGPALGAPVPRLRVVALRGGVRVGVVAAAVARRPAPERRERLGKSAGRRGARPRDVDAP